jgi:hypothetical protein
MERIFLGLAIAICLFSLWAIGRHDLLRLIRPGRRAIAEVTGHRSSWEDSSYTYAAIYRFRDEVGEHEVIDAVYRAVARPDVGTRVELAYPEGRPDLARPPRPLLWALIYLFLTALVCLLAAKAFGWIED